MPTVDCKSIATNSPVPAPLYKGLPIVLSIIKGMLESSGTGSGEFVAILLQSTVVHAIEQQSLIILTPVDAGWVCLRTSCRRGGHPRGCG